MGEFDTSVGPLLLGLFFNTYLYGFVTYQFLTYANMKFNDPTWIKTVVVILFTVDTVHSVVAIYAAWWMCVTNYNNPSILAFIDWTIPFTAVATSVAALITQFFLGHRVLQLTQSKPLVAMLATLSIGGFVFGCYAGIKSGILREVAKFRELVPLVICWLTLQSSADLLITGILTYILSRSKTGFRRTDSIINRLIRGAIQTGLFVSIFALGDLFSFVFFGDTTFYAMFAYPLGRVYTNTLLDTLNARMVFHRIDQSSDSGGIGGWQTSPNYSFRVHTEYPPISGTVEQTSQLQQDTIANAIPLQNVKSKDNTPGNGSSVGI
ncbi:hypothetical protein B0H10DRAFT_287254 [Mycena sp. CBHHK59/15]|nr:hypothetical protein B0H10DRAFT_287254 [Mycena sp. CBHHK59/15]